LAPRAGITRHYLRFIRAEVKEAARDVIARIVLAAREMSGEDVTASDLFYLGESRDDTLPEHLRRRTRDDRPWTEYGGDDEDD
jgi:hypothetical protein